MPNSSSFNKELYDQLKINILMHKTLLELTSENVQQTANNLIKDKKIISSKEGILALCRSIIDIASFYPKNLDEMVELFIYIQNLKYPKEETYLHLLPYYIVKFIHTRENLRLSALYFLRQLVIRKSISLDLIINELNHLPPFNSTKSTQIPIEDDTLLSISNEELDFEENENMQGQLIDHLTPFTQANNKKYQVLMMFFYEIKSKHETIKMNRILNVPNHYSFDPATFHDFLDKSTLPDSITEIIRTDDINRFQLFINSSTDPNFKNQKVKNLNAFERFTILSHEPTLIEYSAFFNSIKIFKYLMLNNADTKAVNNDMFSLVNFAVAGESTEIIRILEQNHFSMVEGISTAIRFYHNEILIYLLDNFFPQSIEDYNSMDNGHYRQKETNGFRVGIKQDDQNRFNFNLNNENDFDYIYNDHDPFNFDYRDESDDKNAGSKDKFAFFNFDVVFQSIVESNNLLALFVLFDHGMKINQRDHESKRTILHWAVQKGKTFLCKLLMSNSFIDTSIVDLYGESAVVYSVKYGKQSIFFEFMKNEKVKSSLTTRDYLLMANYADLNGLQKVTEYLLINFKFDLVDLTKSNELITFCDIVFFAPVFYLFDQIKQVLTDTFVNDNLKFFTAVAARIVIDESFKFSGDFYYITDDGKVVNYESIMSSYYVQLKDDERYEKRFRVYDDIHEYDEFSFELIGFKFHKIENKKQKPYIQISFNHPLLHKYK